MKNSIFTEKEVSDVACEMLISDLSRATIGQASNVATALEQRKGIKFIRMDQGVPGLTPCKIGLTAEKNALESGIAAIYPPAGGIVELKNEASRFIKAFLNIDLSAKGCVPVTGSVTGSFGSFIICSQIDEKKNKVLFIDPGFPIQKAQLNVLGVGYESFDAYNFRGNKLEAKLEEYLSKGDISSIIYSNPNNPAWICLTEEELKIIGTLATKYDIIILEDLAYFSMDFRKDLSHPFEAPYQSTVARYTDNYILYLSGSKIFSYAGQRTAVTAVSDKLYSRKFESLAKRYGGYGEFGETFIASILYMITSGCTHSTQHGLAEMFKAASDGEYDFVEVTKEYERRASRMKSIFKENGFHIVYDKDVDKEVGDGFFFTIGYKNMTSGELMKTLIHYGVSSISLGTTGSEQQGIRGCASRITPDQYEVLNERLKAFSNDFRG